MTISNLHTDAKAEPHNLDVSDPIEVTVEARPTLGANVFSVQVKVDNRAAGVTIVRASPREFAFQDPEPDSK